MLTRALVGALWMVLALSGAEASISVDHAVEAIGNHHLCGRELAPIVVPYRVDSGRRPHSIGKDVIISREELISEHICISYLSDETPVSSSVIWPLSGHLGHWFEADLHGVFAGSDDEWNRTNSLRRREWNRLRFSAAIEAILIDFEDDGYRTPIVVQNIRTPRVSIFAGEVERPSCLHDGIEIGAFSGFDGKFGEFRRLHGSIGRRLSGSVGRFHLANLISSGILEERSLSFASFPELTGGFVEAGGFSKQASRFRRENGRKDDQQPIGNVVENEAIIPSLLFASGLGIFGLPILGFQLRRISYRLKLSPGREKAGPWCDRLSDWLVLGSFFGIPLGWALAVLLSMHADGRL